MIIRFKNWEFENGSKGLLSFITPNRLQQTLDQVWNTCRPCGRQTSLKQLISHLRQFIVRTHWQHQQNCYNWVHHNNITMPRDEYEKIANRPRMTGQALVLKLLSYVYDRETLSRFNFTGSPTTVCGVEMMKRSQYQLYKYDPTPVKEALWVKLILIRQLNIKSSISLDKNMIWESCWCQNIS